MIYECPNCQTPQEAGQTVCPHCHAEFDGPVPDDAVVPAPEAASAQPTTPDTGLTEDAALSEPAPAPQEAPPTFAPQEAPAAAEPPRLVAVPPPASGAQAYPDAPAYPPQNYTPPEPVKPPFGNLSRVLLIAFPIVLVLVLGGVFWANSLNSDGDTAPVPLPAVRASVPASLPAAPVSAPTVLQGAGNGSSGANDPRAKMLAGHWVSKSGSFYVFNGDGSGSRGNQVKQQTEQPFLWGLVQNRLMLYMNNNETLRFNPGPDDDTIFLAGPTGSYVQFTRSKT